MGKVKKGLPSEKRGMNIFLTFVWYCGTGEKRCIVAVTSFTCTVGWDRETAEKMLRFFFDSVISWDLPSRAFG